MKKNNHIQNNILPILITITALCPFASRLFLRSISIDTEQMINTPQRILTSWLYHERPGLVLSKILFGQTTFHYEVEILGTMFFMLLTTLGFVWLMEYPTGVKSKEKEQERGQSWSRYVFPALFLTHPVLAEQQHFLLQSMEVAWAFFLCMAAVGISSIWLWRCIMEKGKTDKGPKAHRVDQFRKMEQMGALEKNRKIPGFYSILLPGSSVIAMAWSFSSYQALITVYIAAAAGMFLLQYDKATEETHSAKEWWSLAFAQVLIFLVGFLLSRIFAKIGLYLSTGSLESTAYVGGMMKWGTQPILQNIKDLYHYAVQVVTGDGMYYTLAYMMAVVGTAWIFVMNIRKKWHRSGYAAYCIAAMIFFLSPFLLAIYTGGADLARAQMALPFVIAFGWSYLLRFINKEDRHSGITAWAAGIAACVFILLQYGQTIRLSYTAYQTYIQECALTQEIAERIQEIGAPADTEVQFVGNWSPQMTDGMVRGETIGYSFYEWDIDKAYGSTERILGLWSTLGYGYMTVAPEKAAQGYETAETMPVWPQDGSVVWKDNVVVVRLSQ